MDSLNLSSNKDLWVLISVTSTLKSKELIGSELLRNGSKICSGVDYYRTISATKRREKADDFGNIDVGFLKNLSTFLNLEINETFNLLCTYLLCEYKGCQSDIQSILKNERHTHGLMVEIWNYYYSERLYLILCMKQLLSHWQDPNHEFQSLYKSFLEQINGDNSNVIIDSVLKQLTVVCDEPVPSKATRGSLMTENRVERWAFYKMREMSELLQILLIYYKEMEPVSEHLHSLLQTFYKNGFGSRIPHKQLLGSPTNEIVGAIGHLEVLVLIEAMELEWLYRSKHVGFDDFYLLKDDATYLKINEAIGLLGTQVHHGPILLSWMLVTFYGRKNDEERPNVPYQKAQLKTLGDKAVKIGTFSYLQSCLQSSIFEGNSVVSQIAHDVVYGLLSTMLSTFEERTLGPQQPLYDVACCLLRHPSTAEDFWRKGSESGVGILIETLTNNFPIDCLTLIRVLSSLAAASESSSEQVVKMFQNLPTFTEYVDDVRSSDLSATSDPSAFVLASSRYPYPNGNFILKEETVGCLSSVEGRQTIQWRCNVNGWQICSYEIHTLLQQAASGADHVNPDTMANVLSVIGLCLAVLKSNPKAIPSFSQLTSMTYALVERFATASSPHNELISDCLHVMSVLAKYDPNDVWSNVLKMGVLPHITATRNQLSILSSYDMDTGIIGNLIASQQYMHGTYSIIKAFLALVSGVSEVIGESEDQNFLACIMLIVQEIFPTYHRWCYVNANDRNKIGQLCLEIFHKILAVPDETCYKKASSAKKIILHSLLFTNLGQPLLQIVATGDDSIQSELEQKTSWCGKSGSDLVHVVRLSLSVLNRLLLLKSTADCGTSDSAPSRVETILSSHSDNLQNHIVLNIAKYIFHRFDPRLTTLAVQLLKRFAKEAPMSLLACLGNDSEAVRDTFLIRLQMLTEDERLKIAILEFLSVCIHQQPGLFEMFVNPSSLSSGAKDNLSCLNMVLDILKQKKEGVSSCLPELHNAAVRFVYYLWCGHKNMAISAIKKDKQFWNYLCFPLLEEPDRGVKINKLLSYLLKILASEFHHYGTENVHADPELGSILDRIRNERMIVKWSKYIREVCSDIDADDSPTDSISRRSVDSIFLLSSWRDFLIAVSRAKNFQFSEDDVECVASDILDIIVDKVSDSQNSKVVHLLSQTYVVLLEVWKSRCIRDDARGWYGDVGKLLSAIVTNGDNLQPEVQLSLIAIITKAVKLNDEITQDFDPRLFCEWIGPACKLIKNTIRSVNRLFNGFNLNLPVMSILLLQLLISEVGDKGDWFRIVRNESIVPFLLSIATYCLQVSKGQSLVQAIFLFFLELAEDPTMCESLNVCGFVQHICLPLSSTYSANQVSGSQEGSLKWIEVYKSSLRLMTSMLKTLKHWFIDDAVQFVGVHIDRIHQSLKNIRSSLNHEVLDEAIVSCRFVKQLILCRVAWQLKHQQSMDLLVNDICSLSQDVCAYLVRPNYLQHIVEHDKVSDVGAQKTGAQKFRRMSSSEELSEMSPRVHKLQITLLRLLSVCLSCLRQVGPSLCQLLSNQNIKFVGNVPVLQIGFGTPPLDKDDSLCFGTMTSCVNMCLRYLTSKHVDSSASPVDKGSSVHQFDKNLLMFILENSLALLLSQAILYLLDPNVGVRDKQLIKREIGTELTSFTVTLSRYMRRGTGAPPSPATSNVISHRTSPSLGKLRSLSPLSEYPFIRFVALIVDEIFK